MYGCTLTPYHTPTPRKSEIVVCLLLNRTKFYKLVFETTRWAEIER